MKEPVTKDTTIEEVGKMAKGLWAGWSGYHCKNCGWHSYGHSIAESRAHILEHLVELLRH